MAEWRRAEGFSELIEDPGDASTRLKTPSSAGLYTMSLAPNKRCVANDERSDEQRFTRERGASRRGG